MFTKVSFQNLRCFKDFTLENLTPITLLSGRNNVGKTTVLEGIYLLLAYCNASVFKTLNGWRRIEQSKNSFPPWSILFANIDSMAQQLRISATDEKNKTRAITFSEKFSREKPYLEYVCESRPECEHREIGGYFWDPEDFGITLRADGLNARFLLPPSVHYVGPSTNLTSQTATEWLGKVEIENKKEQLLQNLRFLYNEVIDIFSVLDQGTNSIYARLGTGKPLPFSAMGDGINKLLYYLSAMIVNPGKVFLLDEIENGFHHKFYSKLWELLARVAKETGSQIFATTHSYECIAAAHDGVSEVDPALLTYVRLGKEKAGIVPHYFSGDDLDFVLERDMEVR